MDLNRILRELPKIDELMRDERISRYQGLVAENRMLGYVREVIENMRREIIRGEWAETGREVLRELVVADAAASLEKFLGSGLRKVINATGVIIHTNLGRSPMSKRAALRAAEAAQGYVSLEYDVYKGSRGNRTNHLERILCDLIGAEAALAVNNNAAAVFLAINTLCSGKEAVLSRGEIVEIGDSFRVSEIIRLSGAKVSEVGTTNRTRIEDYESAISGDTGLLLKIHASNFKVVGFTGSVSTRELGVLAEEYGIPLLEDMGSGVLTDLTKFGLKYERTVMDAVKEADIVTFSGDKMLGGPQAGILAGKKKYIDKIRKNQLLRCMRVDKFTIASLEAVLSEYYTGKETPDLPVFKYLSCDVHKKCETFCKILADKPSPYKFEIGECFAQIGGGALPGEDIASFGIFISSDKYTPNEIESFLRNQPVPVISTVKEGFVILNMMTVDEADFAYIGEIFHA